MTIEQLQKIPFHFVCSAAWEDEHTLTYASEDGRLGYCDHPLPDVSIDPSLLEQHPRMFERSRQTGSGVSLSIVVSVGINLEQQISSL